MCCGKDPTGNDDKDHKNVAKKYDTVQILFFISFIIYCFVSPKIFLYQRKIEKTTKNIELGCMQDSKCSNQQNRPAQNDEPEFKARNMPKSMADLRTQFLCMMLFLSFVIVSYFIHQIEPKELNLYENRWFVYYFQIIGVAFTILGISCQYYVKNKSLRNGIWRQIKDRWWTWQLFML